MGSRLSPQLRTNLLDQHNKHRSPCQCTATGECLWFSEQKDQGKLHLRHDRKVNDLDNRELWHLAIHNNGHVKPCPRAAPEESRRRTAQFALWVLVSTRKTATVDELNLGHLQVKLLGIFAAWSQGRHRRTAPRSRRPPRPASHHRRRFTTSASSISSWRRSLPTPTPSGTAPRCCNGFRRAAGQHEHLEDEVGDSATVV